MANQQATQFNIPSSPTLKVYKNDRFLGADFTSDASTVDETKSPNTVNMIRSVPGKIRKRMGYKEIGDYKQRIWGVHHLSTTDIWLIHAGDKLYNLSAPKGRKWSADNKEVVTADKAENIMLLTGDYEDTMIYSGMAQHRSVSLELSQKLIILDGKKALIFDGFTVKDLSDNAYIPTLRISENPEGGGTDYEALNLLQPAWQEWFICDADHASTKEFQLAFGTTESPLDDTKVKAWLLNGDGDWIEKTEGTDFTVDRTKGKVTFVTAPGKTPLAGEDNVKIQAYRTVKGYSDRVNHCTFGTLFGVNGAQDRLFISGNPDKGENEDGELFTYICYDWFSGQYDPTYFADTHYSQLGSDSTAIVGYSIINNYLAAFKGGNEQSQAVLIREGDITDDEPTFKVVNTLQGVGAVSPYSFAYLETEPLFLTKLGVYAITAQDITGEKYAQNRSYYLDGKLTEEENLNEAYGFTFKDFYMLAVNSHVYVLDGQQPMQTDKSRPYATRQYAGFYWDDVPSSVFFEYDNTLCFGATDGKIYAFYKDKHELESYNDNGKEYSAIWETADISEQLFYKNKNYRYLAIRCMPEIVSSVEIWAQRRGIWERIKEDATTLKYFSYQHLTYSKFTYSTDSTAKVSSTKVRLKKLDHVRFRFENNRVNEPFGLNDFAVEYTQGGNHK